MKAHELARQLLEGPDVEVILQKDSEGNGYSPLSGADPNCIYVAECTWQGDVYSTNWTAEDACMEEHEWEAFKKENRQVVVLYPIN